MHHFFFYHSLRYLPIPSNDDKSFWVNAILAFLTFLAVLIALLQEKLKRYFNRAILDMHINLAPPDSHQIDLTDERGMLIYKSIYIRIKVTHIKGLAGENVEIMPTSFLRVDPNGATTPVSHFLPINLVWSHFQPRTNTIRVPVNGFRHCDFGHIIKSHPHNVPLLILDTMVQPNPVSRGNVPNVFQPGKYQFELLMSGDNIRALRKRWEIEFLSWSDDEAIMLSGIKLRELP